VKKSPLSFLFLIALLCGSVTVLAAQEGQAGEEQALEEQNGENPDFDSIFDNARDTEEIPDDSSEDTILDTLRDRVIVAADYNFMAGFSPGWAQAPWFDEGREFSYVLGAKMDAVLSLDFRLSESLRVWNSFSFSVPEENVFSIKEFYFDYNMNRLFYLRAGLFTIAWGISPNFPFTNLPARIPGKNSVGDSYIGKLDIPIGIGGLQLIGMTRQGFMDDASAPKFDEIAYGFKYNLAFSGADIDAGLFYYAEMPLRFFASLKTTVVNTELYIEGLAAVSHDTWDDVRFSGSTGFIQDFFRGKLTVNGEFFYNGERGTEWWYQGKSEVNNEESSPLFGGFNTALGLIFRPGIIGMRIFCKALYAVEENSAQLIPGISIKPGDLVTVTLTVPMALGSRRGYYYNNVDMADTPRPFNIALLVSFQGSFRYGL
jgi:hypothetical protein